MRVLTNFGWRHPSHPPFLLTLLSWPCLHSPASLLVWVEFPAFSPFSEGGERKFILSTIDDSFKVLTSFDEISFSANNVYTLRDLKNCGWNHMMLPFNWNLLCYLILGILKKTKLGFCELIFGLKGLISHQNNYWRNATVKSTFGSNNCRQVPNSTKKSPSKSHLKCKLTYRITHERPLKTT